MKTSSTLLNKKLLGELRELLSKQQEYNQSVDEYITAFHTLMDSFRKDYAKVFIGKIDENSSFYKLMYAFPDASIRRMREVQLARYFCDYAKWEAIEVAEEDLKNKLNELLQVPNPTKEVRFRIHSLFKLRNKLEREENPIDVINYLGMPAVLQGLKDSYVRELNNPDVEELQRKGINVDYYKQEMSKIIDNFDALFEYATPYIQREINLKISIQRTNYKGKNEYYFAESTEDASDNNVALADHEDQVVNDNLDFQIRKVNPKDTLSTKVKEVLSALTMYEAAGVNEDGTTLYVASIDDLGNTRYMDPDFIHSVLLKELSDIKDISEFIEIVDEDDRELLTIPPLRKLVNKYPWMIEVINQLEGYRDSPEDSNTLALFFNDMFKDYVRRDIVKDGKVININKPIGEEEIQALFEYNFENGITVSKEEDSLYNRASKLVEGNFEKAKQLLIRDEIVEFTPDQLNKRINILSELLNRVGVVHDKEGLKGLYKKTEKTDDEGNPLWSPNEDYASFRSALSGILYSYNNIDRNNSTYARYNAKRFRTLFKIVGDLSNAHAVITVREGDQTYQNYVCPGYIEKQFKWLRAPKTDRELDARKAYIAQEFKQYDWFYDAKKGEWKNTWLEWLTEEDTPIDGLEGKVSLFDKFGGFELREIPKINDKEFKDWEPDDIQMAGVVTFADSLFAPDTAGQVLAWYTVPMMSNSPICKQVRAFKFEARSATLKKAYRKMVYQEMDRIKLVQQRKQSNVHEISNFDKRGLEFCFFPFFNKYKDDFLAQYTSSKEGSEERKNLDNSIDEKIGEYLNKEIAVLTSQIGAVVRESLKEKLKTYYKEDLQDYINIHSEDKEKAERDRLNFYVQNIIKEFVWNNNFATANIYQLLITDLAFHKNMEEVQKRFKEVLSTGIKPFIYAEKGTEFERAIILKDIIRPSRFLSFVKNIVNEAISQGNLTKVEGDSIIKKMSEINQADAQAFRTLDSYECVMSMFGRLDPDVQEAINHIRANKVEIKDLLVLLQALKPFVYTQIAKPSEVVEEDGSSKLIKVPQQHKNSESLLLTLYNATNQFAQSQMLQGLNQFMVDNNIHVAQFESAVKSGSQGVIDIGVSPSKMVKEITNGIVDNGNNTLSVYLAKAFDRYLLPANVELKNVDSKEIEKLCNSDSFNLIFEKAMEQLAEDGKKVSQETINDLYDRLEPSKEEAINILTKYTHKRDEKGNLLTDSNGKYIEEECAIHKIPYRDYCLQQPTDDHLMDTEAILGSQFKNLITGNIDPDFEFTYKDKTYKGEKVVKLFQQLMTANIIDNFEELREEFKDVEALSEYLTSMVKGNPRYGSDILNALKVVSYKEGDRMVKTFNLPLDNPTTIEKIDELILSQFKNRIAKQKICGGNAILVSSIGYSKDLQIEYNDDGSWKGVQCYLPAWSKQFFGEALTKEGGSWILDPSKIDKQLLRAIGYRIPTEEKYSMAPLIVKGFLAQNQGSSIMYPAELMAFSGEDCDVDKKFLILPNFEKGPDGKLKLVEYDNSKSILENTKEQRDNLLFEISYAILTSKSAVRDIHNPGNFDKLKRNRNYQFALNSKENLRNFLEFAEEKRGITFDEENLDTQIFKFLEEVDDDFLTDFFKKYATQQDPLSLLTYCYYHKQNMIGGKLIGVYAVASVAHSKFQHLDVSLKDEYTFTFNGKRIKKVDPKYVIGTNKLVSFVISQFSAASVNRIDFVLADLMQNAETAAVAVLMARLGMDIHEICILLTQPDIKAIIKAKGGLDKKELNKNMILLQSVVTELAEEIGEDWHLKEMSEVNVDTNALLATKLHMIQGKKLTLVDYDNRLQVLMVMQNLVFIAEKMRELVTIARADSPNGAVGISMGEAYTQVRRAKAVYIDATNPNYPFENIQEIYTPGLFTGNETKEELYEKLDEKKLPAVQAAYTLGIEATQVLLKDFKLQAHPVVQSMLDEISDECKTGIVHKTFAKNFVEALIRYELSATQMFGNEVDREGNVTKSYMDKRLEYLVAFPTTFAYAVRTNPELRRKCPIITRILVQKNTLKMLKGADVSNLNKEQLKLEMNTLLLEDPDLAHNLFVYTYFAENLKFGPTTINTYFSTDFLNAFPEYVFAIRNIKKKLYSEPSFYEKFKKQFISNNAAMFVSYKSETFPEEIWQNYDGIVAVKNTIVWNNFTRNPRKWLNLNGNLYELQSENEPYCIYAPMPKVKGYSATLTIGEILRQNIEESRKLWKDENNLFNC